MDVVDDSGRNRQSSERVVMIYFSTYASTLSVEKYMSSIPSSL